MNARLSLLMAVLSVGGCTLNSVSSGVAPSTYVPLLDWDTPNRWIHVDTVPEKGVAQFESARHRWLDALKRTGLPLDDGRPLVWSGVQDGSHIYMTFYPFQKFSELDTRAAIVQSTQKQVGEAAVSDYDLNSDTVLIPPHYSQIWAHDPNFDFISPLNARLDERSATNALIEFQQLNYAVTDGGEAIWTTVIKVLHEQRYPLTCLTFSSRYGTGQTIRLWLAPDADTLHAAPSLAKVFEQALGAEKGRALDNDLNSLLATQQRFEIERRIDMSNDLRKIH